MCCQLFCVSFNVKETIIIKPPFLCAASQDSGKAGNKDDVIELTDANFEKEVLNSKDLVLVEFFAPW